MLRKKLARCVSTVLNEFKNIENVKSNATLGQTLSRVVEKDIGSKVSVSGWVRSIRRHKNYSFLIMNDGSCMTDLQLVLSTHMANA